VAKNTLHLQNLPFQHKIAESPNIPHITPFDITFSTQTKSTKIYHTVGEWKEYA